MGSPLKSGRDLMVKELCDRIIHSEFDSVGGWDENGYGGEQQLKVDGTKASQGLDAVGHTSAG
jgi:hypothetical protein